ncbi:hypothetical protein [Pseudomonas piscis]|nr:hypothetical protein [Pseudomonas piscis]
MFTAAQAAKKPVLQRPSVLFISIAEQAGKTQSIINPSAPVTAVEAALET